MRRAYLLALFLVSCTDDPPKPADCSGPDFEVLITALDAPLPADTVVRIEYGGGEMEEYELANPGRPIVLFCKPSDREGNLVPAAGGEGGQGPEGAAGSHEPGDAGGRPSAHAVEGLHCDLWTDGPATMTIETAAYPTEPVELKAKQGKCTVEVEVELGPDDGGA